LAAVFAPRRGDKLAAVDHHVKVSELQARAEIEDDDCDRGYYQHGGDECDDRQLPRTFGKREEEQIDERER
jgi:hypothetical protein